MSYTIDILNEYIKQTDATIKVNELPKLGKDSRIPFICSCGKEDSKTFIRIKFSGVLCKECTEISRRNKRETTNLDKYGTTCTLQALDIKKKAEESTMQKFGVRNILQSKVMQDKIKQTNIQKYGVENPFASPEIIQKIRNVCKEKYGVEHPMQVPEIKQRVNLTNLQKYGVENVSQTEYVKQKRIDRNMEKYGTPHPITHEVLKKIQATNLQRYGFKYTCEVPFIQRKIQDTFIRKYGHKSALKNKDIQNKIRSTMIRKYGVNWSMQSKIIQQTHINNNIQKYGVKYPLQNREVQASIEKNAFKFKKYICPSGETRLIQGYEHFALDKLINEMNLSEEDIITSRLYIPIISYLYNNNERKYYPDIFIKSLNKIIEVKSTWTYKLHKTQNIEKWKATMNAGYKCEFWIFTKSGQLQCIENPLIDL